MNDQTIIQCARLACGTALLIAISVLRTDGALTALAMVLMGVPFEVLKRENVDTSTAKAPA